jgi:phage shock protein A
MAGLTSRLKRITVSRIQAFLETVDEPEAVFPKLVGEMQKRIGDAVNAESKAAAAFKANQRRLDESLGRSVRLEKGAEMALRQGNEPLAREALEAQVRVERRNDDQRLALEQSERALVQARESRLHLEVQLEELKRRKKEIISRARSAKNAAGVRRRAWKIGASGAAILDEVARMEQVAGENEISSGIAGELSGTFERSLEYRLRSLEREAEIERRLDSIKKRKQSASKLDA